MATDLREKMADLAKQVVKLRDKGEKSWAEIGEELEIAPGKAMLAYDFAQVGDDEVVTAKNEEELGKKIAKMRDTEGLSWGKIMARTGRGEQNCRSLYEAATGESTKGNRIGKGGRYPNGMTPPTKVAKATKATKATKVAKATKAVKATKATKATKAARPTKAAGAKKAGGRKATKSAEPKGTKSPASGSLSEMDFDELTDRLEGRKIQYEGPTGGMATITVRTVKSLNGDEVELIDAQSGNTRTLLVSRIKKATK